MKWIDFELDGVVRRVPATRSGGRLWFHWRGRTYVVDSGPRRAAARAGPVGGGSGVVTAPMPGKITRVTALVGADVTKGQVLVVMEAMKMEYSLEADVAGQVAKVNAAVGDVVAQGATLIRITPA